MSGNDFVDVFMTLTFHRSVSSQILLVKLQLRLIFRPILYAAFTNDIVCCFTYGRPILYADNLKIIFPIDLSEIRKSHYQNSDRT